MYAPVDGAHRFVTMSTNADIRRILGSVLTRMPPIMIVIECFHLSAQARFTALLILTVFTDRAQLERLMVTERFGIHLNLGAF